MSEGVGGITHADRVAAWPFADFHCLPDSQMRERWYLGWYDNLEQSAAIRAFAQHRLATQPPQETPHDK